MPFDGFLYLEPPRRRGGKGGGLGTGRGALPDDPRRRRGEWGERGGGGGGLRDRQDPDDEGQLPDYLLPLSRSLARALRYECYEQGLDVDTDGWVPMNQILGLPSLIGCMDGDLEMVVKESYSRSQKRFELQQREGGTRWLRATGHRKGGGPIGGGPIGGGPIGGGPIGGGPIGGGPVLTPQPSSDKLGATFSPPKLSEFSEPPPLPPPPLQTCSREPPPGKPPVLSDSPTGGLSSPPPLSGAALVGSPRPEAPGSEPPATKIPALDSAAPARQAEDAPSTEATAPPAPAVPASGAAQDPFVAAGGDPWARGLRGGWQPKPGGSPARKREVGVAPTEAATAAAQAQEPSPASQVERPAAAAPGAALEPAEEEKRNADGASAGGAGIRSSTGTVWQAFREPEEQGGGTWWWGNRADGSEDFFLERAPGDWVERRDGKSSRRYWVNCTSGESFWVDDA